MGNPGTGKTHLATAIARTLKKQGYLVGHMTKGMLLSKIKATYQKGSSTTEESILNDLKKIELLILDDLGSEARNRDEFDWSKNKLFEIVNLRIGKPTIYTTNFSEQHLPTAIGERVFSRLYNNTKFITLVTDDYRKKFLIK
jgi:DNA replication protein DnaC